MQVVFMGCVHQMRRYEQMAAQLEQMLLLACGMPCFTLSLPPVLGTLTAAPCTAAVRPKLDLDLGRAAPEGSAVSA